MKVLEPAKLLWIFAFLTIEFPLKITSILQKCQRSENCECFNNSDHYMFQCGSSNSGNTLETILHIYPDSSVKLDCDNVAILNATKLPKMTFENVTKLQVRYCPVPISGIREITQHFRIASLEFLSFEFGIFQGKTLRTSDFQGIGENVKILRLRGNQLEQIEENFFEAFPNLLSMELDRNRLNLPEINAPNLKFLSLSDNNLTHFPKNSNLDRLERLNLWKNALENFNATKIPNLKSLELAYNKISKLEFSNFPKLTNVSVRNNLIRKINRETLISNPSLENFEISGNSISEIDEHVFSNMKNLRKINLNNAKLSKLPEKLFENSTNLNEILMERNEIREIPSGIFRGLENLKKISLSFNQIEKFNDGIFDALINLEKLDVQHNKLEEISENLLKSTNLKELNLSYNNIGIIAPEAFTRLKNLIRVNLSHNRIIYKESGIYPVSPFNKCTNLEEVNLSNNEILDFPEDLMWLATMRNIDLSWNNLTKLRVNSLWKVGVNELKLNLEYNRISVLDFEHVELTAMNQPELDAVHNQGAGATVVKISGNPLKCDCYANDFVRYLRNEMYPGVKTAIYFTYEKLQCAAPDLFENYSVELLKPEMLSCPIDEVVTNFTCVSNRKCGCHWRPFDKSLVINCARKNLTNFPEIPRVNFTRFFNRTVLDLSGNSLRKFEKITGYDDVTELYIQNNNLSEITWLPQQLQILNLSHNKLSHLDWNVLQVLNRTNMRIFLDDNPWKCVCSTSNFTNFLRQRVHELDTREIYCAGTTKRLINLNEKDLCPYSSFLLISTTVLILVLCVFTSLAALYYKYQQQIKVWMYAHNIFLFLIEEEELDKDKIYDAFISYSHKDEEFVVENLVAPLENGGAEAYKLCLHFRNWIPGEFIATQITSSVQNSRRTLVVLSPSFLESVWGKMEFRTAHTEAMKEGRARVIIVLLDEIDVESLDDELKAYMKTNTYIKWGDPWFWDKLKYALPHTKIKGTGVDIQKHANMMKYIDDKFSMISTDSSKQHAKTIVEDDEEIK